MIKAIRIVFYGIFGGLLGAVGFPIWTWQFWALLLLVIGINICATMEHA